MIAFSALNLNKAIESFRTVFGDKLEFEKPMAEMTTFRVGGKALLFLMINTIEELVDAIRIANANYVPYFIIGGGSNILVSDNGFEGLIIKNAISGLEQDGQNINAGGGEDLQNLVDFATENSLSGLEFAAGIYGTVGGAIYGNAGAYGKDISTVLKSVELVDKQGNIRIEETDYLQFAYRWSRLKETGEIVARATFALKLGKREQIKQKIDEIHGNSVFSCNHNPN